jgi:hypothetical protein
MGPAGHLFSVLLIALGVSVVIHHSGFAPAPAAGRKRESLNLHLTFSRQGL